MVAVTLFQTVPAGADSDTTTPFDYLGSGSIDLSLGETEIITFDFMNANYDDLGTFSIGTAPAAGSLDINDADTGTATFTITQAQWVLAGSPSSITFGVINSNDSLGATYELTITCFAAGTSIATPGGGSPVEKLAIGDMVLAAGGRAVPVKWVGRQSVMKRFAGLRAEPVRISAGALGGGLPKADLTVTADHGMVLDGMVINASALVNGTTIDWVPLADLPERFTVYHVETEAHDVILANGAASETYVDIPGRAVFDNFQEYLALYGTEQPIAENPMPRISASRLLPEAIRTRLGIQPVPPVAITA